MTYLFYELFLSKPPLLSPHSNWFCTGSVDAVTGDNYPINWHLSIHERDNDCPTIRMTIVNNPNDNCPTIRKTILDNPRDKWKLQSNTSHHFLLSHCYLEWYRTLIIIRIMQNTALISKNANPGKYDIFGLKFLFHANDTLHCGGCYLLLINHHNH